ALPISRAEPLGRRRRDHRVGPGAQTLPAGRRLLHPKGGPARRGRRYALHGPALDRERAPRPLEPFITLLERAGPLAAGSRLDPEPVPWGRPGPPARALRALRPELLAARRDLRRHVGLEGLLRDVAVAGREARAPAYAGGACGAPSRPGRPDAARVLQAHAGRVRRRGHPRAEPPLAREERRRDRAGAGEESARRHARSGPR